MRIIAGSARGRRIAPLPGDDTRPSADRVKEALFAIIQGDVPEARVLDLFSGTGNLALEALSRGAEHAICNDARRECTSLIDQNARTLGFGDRIDIKQMDYLRCLSSLAGSRFDVIFLDPPYASDCAGRALAAIAEGDLLAEEGVVVYERGDKAAPALTVPIGLVHSDSRRYGATRLEFFRRAETIGEGQGSDSQ